MSPAPLIFPPLMFSFKLKRHRESRIADNNSDQQDQGSAALQPQKFNAREYLRTLCPEGRAIAEQMDKLQPLSHDQ